MKPPTPFGALVALALRLCARRWWFYLIAIIITIGAQAAALAIHALHNPLFVASTVLQPVLVLIVYVFAGTDATGEDASVAARWERVLERSWAVIIIDIIGTMIMTYTFLGMGSEDPMGLFGGLAGYALLLLTIYADVNAALEPKVRTLWLIPGAFVRSATLATHRANIFLTLTLVAISVLFVLLSGIAASGLVALHVPAPSVDFWINTALLTALQVPLSALAVVVYLECVSREKAAATGR